MRKAWIWIGTAACMLCLFTAGCKHHKSSDLSLFLSSQSKTTVSELTNEQLYCYAKPLSNTDTLYFEWLMTADRNISYRFCRLREAEAFLSEEVHFTTPTNVAGNVVEFSLKDAGYDLRAVCTQNSAKLVADGGTAGDAEGVYTACEPYTNPFPQPKSTRAAYAADHYTEGFEMDAALAAGIRAHLGLPADALLTKAMLVQITDLYIWDHRPVRLEGIQLLENLSIFALEDNYLTDISPLCRLEHLTQISIGNGYIEKVPDFSKNRKLNEIHITGNFITDMQPFLNIPNLKILDLTGNRITSVAALKNAVDLEMLNVSGNPITDYALLQNNIPVQQALVENYAECMLVENAAKQIIGNIITPDMTDLEKEIAIYQYLLETMSYNEEQRPHRPYGYYGIVENYGVCGDYADSMTLLGVFAKLDILSVYSNTHAWNIIKLDGQYYNLDVLWDDQNQNHQYFNRSNAFTFADTDHIYNLDRFPICTSDMNPLYYSHFMKK